MRMKFASATVIIVSSTGWVQAEVPPNAARLNTAIAQCGKSKIDAERLDACSIVISATRNPVLLERAYNRRGHANMALSRYEAAANDFTQIIRLNPRVAGYFDNRQNAYRSFGRMDSALADANEAVRLAPNYPFVYYGRGSLYALWGKYGLAISDYNTAISLEPLNSYAYLDRGKIYAKAKRPREAIGDFSRARDLDENNVLALRERGLALKELGRSEEARADLVKFAASQPNDPEVSQALISLPTPALPGLSPAPSAVSPPAPAPSIKSEDKTSIGSGFFIDNQGHFITNAHVVKGCQTTIVKLPDGQVRHASINTTDAVNDLALLQVSGTEGHKHASLRSGMRLGEGIAAFGYPHVDVLAGGGNFTLGNVTALAGINDDSRYYQISAPVQQGNSGGPLLDNYGNVAGVVTGKLNALKVALQSGDFPQNVNFALKGALLASFIESNGATLTTGSAVGAKLDPADLADAAKAVSGLVACQ